MATKTWRVEVAGRAHTVTARHGYWSAERLVEVDGHRVVDVRPRTRDLFGYYQTSTEHPFLIDGHPAALRVIPGSMWYALRLVVDGREVDTDAPALELDAPARYRADAERSTTKAWQWIVLAGLLLLPLGLAAYLWGYRDIRIQLDGAEAPGVVLSHFSTAGRYGEHSNLRYRFQLPDGRSMSGTQEVGYDFYIAVSDGDRVTVEYVRADPTINRVDPEIDRRAFLIYAALSMLGCSLAGGSVVVGRMIARRREALRRKGRSGTARVTSVEGRRSKGPFAWSIGYSYVDDRGVEHSGHDDVPSESGRPPTVGDRIAVRYDERAPQRSGIDLRPNR